MGQTHNLSEIRAAKPTGSLSRGSYDGVQFETRSHQGKSPREFETMQPCLHERSLSSVGCLFQISWSNRAGLVWLSSWSAAYPRNHLGQSIVLPTRQRQQDLPLYPHAQQPQTREPSSSTHFLPSPAPRLLLQKQLPSTCRRLPSLRHERPRPSVSYSIARLAPGLHQLKQKRP